MRYLEFSTVTCETVTAGDQWQCVKYANLRVDRTSLKTKQRQATDVGKIRSSRTTKSSCIVIVEPQTLHNVEMELLVLRSLAATETLESGVPSPDLVKCRCTGIDLEEINSKSISNLLGLSLEYFRSSGAISPMTEDFYVPAILLELCQRHNQVDSGPGW